MDKLHGCIFIENDDLLEKYAIWDKVNANIKKNLVVSLP